MKWLWAKTTRLDFLIIFLLTSLVIWNPFYLQQKINLFELGLYLPGIDAVTQGMVPYRDFFHLRGPFELYFPAFCMNIFGQDVATLSTYFYVGNALTILLWLVVAYSVFPNRLFFYTLAPVLVARTFPRVVFTYWGGMRFAWGVLAVLTVILYLKRQDKRWLLAAGFVTAIAGLTSIEIGVSSFMAIMILLCGLRDGRAIRMYVSGILLLMLPYFIYLLTQHALADYIHAQWVVATQMTKTFPQIEPVPSNIMEVLKALFIPTDKNFRQMTPIYCYIIFFFYFWKKRKAHQLDTIDKAVSVTALYGFFIYVTGFRNLWSNIFEMSLQPEKIVFFYILARFIFYLSENLKNKKVVIVIVICFIVSSLGYSVDRFNKRFLFFRHKPFKDAVGVTLHLPRVKNMTVPEEQAEDLNQLHQFMDAHTQAGEIIWMYPELASLHFILNRPWVGKFPLTTLAWMDEGFYTDYMKELMRLQPQYAIVNKQMPEYFLKGYFPVAENQRKFDEQMAFLQTHYFLVDSTPTYNIYKHIP